MMVMKSGSISQKLSNSIRMKLILCFMIIIVILEFASIFAYFSGRSLNELYNRTLEKHLQFNEVFVTLGSTNEYLQRYLQNDDPKDLKQFHTESSKLSLASERLEYIVNDGGYDRDTIDLKNMIASYTEAAEKSIEYKDKLDYEKSNDSYYDAEDINKLINKNFKSVYTVILKDTNDVKIKVIDSRNRTNTLNGILLFFVGVISVLFGKRVAEQLTDPIRVLTQHASAVTKEITEGRIPQRELEITTNDEVSILTQAINKMISKITQQITEIQSKAEIEKKLNDEEMENLKIKALLKESELKALQSRINPHFLFNTLNMVSQTAYIEEAEQTTALIEVLSGLLRYNLDTFNKPVTLEAEISNVKDYVFIQEKRFGKRINFKFDIDNDILSSRVPCLVLQPLVENSVIHGVGKFTEGGEIGIQIKGQEGRVIMCVYDNGKGMEQDELDALMKAAGDESGIENDSSDRIGFRNVCARLRLFYNDDIIISINSIKNTRTEIKFSLPYTT